MAQYLLKKPQIPWGRAALGIAQESRIERIAAAIERYLSINPLAADSVVGIAQWWLPLVGMEVASEEVEEALLLLQARGVVERVSVGEGQRFWRLANAVIGPEES